MVYVLFAAGQYLGSPGLRCSDFWMQLAAALLLPNSEDQRRRHDPGTRIDALDAPLYMWRRMMIVGMRWSVSVLVCVPLGLTAAFARQPEVRLEPANRQMENEAAVLRDAAADAQAVYTFVGWMLVIGALSLVAVQRRKLKSASLYDRRSKA